MSNAQTAAIVLAGCALAFISGWFSHDTQSDLHQVTAQEEQDERAYQRGMIALDLASRDPVKWAAVMAYCMEHGLSIDTQERHELNTYRRTMDEMVFASRDPARWATYGDFLRQEGTAPFIGGVDVEEFLRQVQTERNLSSAR